jgi:hypothetical protein
MVKPSKNNYTGRHEDTKLYETNDYLWLRVSLNALYGQFRDIKILGVGYR